MSELFLFFERPIVVVIISIVAVKMVEAEVKEDENVIFGFSVVRCLFLSKQMPFRVLVWSLGATADDKHWERAKGSADVFNLTSERLCQKRRIDTRKLFIVFRIGTRCMVMRGTRETDAAVRAAKTLFFLLWKMKTYKINKF